MTPKEINKFIKELEKEGYEYNETEGIYYVRKDILELMLKDLKVIK